MAFDRLKALDLLAECTGDDIWSLDYCHKRGVPPTWMEELGDCFESNPQRDSETIYLKADRVNQYEGIRDVDLAIRLGSYLGIDVHSIIDSSLSRSDLVRRIIEVAEDG